MEHYTIQYNIDVWIEKKQMKNCLDLIYNYLIHHKTGLLVDIQKTVSTSSPIIFWNNKQLFELFCCLMSSMCDEKYTWSLCLQYYYVYIYYHLFVKN